MGLPKCKSGPERVEEKPKVHHRIQNAQPGFHSRNLFFAILDWWKWQVHWESLRFWGSAMTTLHNWLHDIGLIRIMSATHLDEMFVYWVFLFCIRGSSAKLSLDYYNGEAMASIGLKRTSLEKKMIKFKGMKSVKKMKEKRERGRWEAEGLYDEAMAHVFTLFWLLALLFILSSF